MNGDYIVNGKNNINITTELSGEKGEGPEGSKTFLVWSLQVRNYEVSNLQELN